MLRSIRKPKTVKTGQRLKAGAARVPAASAERGGVSASMTIYLALMLVIILSLIFALTESARVSAVLLSARSLTYLSADSVFSEYGDSVFSEYGIMVLWKDEDEFISEFEDYAEAGIDTSDILYAANADLYGLSFTGAALESVTYITDSDGLLFAQQVYEYMAWYITQSSALEILEELGIFGQSSEVSEFMEEVNSYSDVFAAVEESVSDIREEIEQAQEITPDPSQLLGSLYDAVYAYAENDVSASVFSSALTDLKNAQSEIESALEDIRQASEAYYESTQSALEAVNGLEADLENMAQDLSSDVYESLAKQLSALKEQSSDTETDYYGVAANEEVLEEYISMIESLEDLFEQLDGSLTEENAAEYMEVISEYQKVFEDFDLSRLGVDSETESVQTESTSVLSFITGLVGKGVTAYVKEDISEKTTDLSELPSVQADISGSDEDEDLSELSANRIIFGQYVLSHFGNAVSVRDDTALEYEAEYVIGGKSSDLENLKVVVGKLVTLRSGLNLISLMQDTDKMAEIETLAAAMAGFTGMPLLTKAAELLIMSAWSAAEAIADVKALLEGQKVPAIKDSDEWSLTIEGFKNFNGKDLETVSCDDGLGYEDYLRVLLAMQDPETQYFRTMDLIQMDICLNENEEFKMADCMESVEVTAYYTASQLFASPLSSKNLTASSGGRYSFAVTQVYGY